jgi:hypothetical protein
MKDVNFFSPYVSTPIRIGVYIFGFIMIFYTYRLIHAINRHTQEIEKQVTEINRNFEHHDI